MILRDPENKIVDFKESSRVAGGWLGPYPYWDNGRVTANPVVGTNSIGEPTAGTYTFILQLRIDPRYPDLHTGGRTNFNWPAHAGRWITRTWKIHVYSCR